MRNDEFVTLNFKKLKQMLFISLVSFDGGAWHNVQTLLAYSID
jgi:hypothetical protein